MIGTIFKAHLIRKLIIAGAFTVLTVGAVVGVNVANEAIKPYEGFITDALVSVDTKGEKNNMGDKLAVEIEQEGIVLAQNNDNVLPLAKDNMKVDVYGHSVVDWLISNSGSGSSGPGSAQSIVGLLEAFDAYGVEYNEDIINYYKSWLAPRSLPYSISCGYDDLYRLADPDINNVAAFKNVYDGAKSAEDVNTAIVCLSRAAGEHIDPPHEQINNHVAANGSTKSTDKTRGYLELTVAEENLLTAVGQDYENVIVIINSSNVMQMDFMKRIPGLDACLIVGPTGTVGAKAIPQVLYGDVNPSGRTADTWPMNHRYNPTYFTSGYWPSNDQGPYYTGSGATNWYSQNTQGGVSFKHANFADYIEGIYVGYRWFETADAEGYWDNDTYGGYDNVVAYPFGHGLSYSQFKWEFYSSLPTKNSVIKENEDITLTVEVTNTGKVAGRDVVEVYLTAPYIKGGIEKSSVKLVGYQKTSNLMPGEKEQVKIVIHTRDFRSFDCYDKNGNGHTGWEMDAGNYEIKLMKSCHEIKEGTEIYKYRVNDTINIDEDDATGNEVKTLFTGNEAVDGIAIDGSNTNQNVQYLTRENFAPLLTQLNANRAWDNSLNDAKYSKTKASNWDKAEYDVFGNPTPTDKLNWGVNHDLKVTNENYELTELGRELAEDYNSEKWDELLEQVTWKESTAIVANNSSYNRPGIKSVGLRKGSNNDYKDVEAASQVGVDLDNKTRRLTAYPTPTVQAQCWNVKMPYNFGLSEAKDMVIGGADASYGPASNIHRSPYGGCNSEYHSEDGLLAGYTLAAVTKGLSDGGKQGFIKHFAVNDTEFHRVGLFTWLTEQALREVYLRPFEEAIKRGEATALMTSFNRVGAIWAGGSEALCQGVLRNEWGFKGMTITDMIENSNLMDGNQHFRAGNNYILGGSGWSTGVGGTPAEASATPRMHHRMRENAKQVIYGHIRVLRNAEIYNAGNSVGPIAGNQNLTGKAPDLKAPALSKRASDLTFKPIPVSAATKARWIWWKPALYCLEALVVVACVFGIVCALLPANKEFRDEAKNRLFKKKKGDEEAETNEEAPQEEAPKAEKKENWFIRHMRLTAAIAIFGVTFIVIGAVMLTSFGQYKAQEKKYYQQDLETRSALPAEPKNAEINDNYKSKYKIVNFIEEDNHPDVDGKFIVNMEIKAKSFMDIDIIFNSESTTDLLSLMNIKVNDSLIEESGLVVDRDGDGEAEWHHLIMSDFALPAGEFKLEIAPIAKKTMPDIQKITFYTSADANIII